MTHKMHKWKWFSGHIGGGVAWFRIKGYGIAAIRRSSFSSRSGYHKKFIRLGNWHIETLAP